MTACIVVPIDYDMAGIARAAGQPDDNLIGYSGDTLCVEGVTQEALEAALAAYDHLAYVKSQKRRELRLAHNVDYKTLFTLEGTFIEADRDWVIRQEAKGLGGAIVQTKIDQMDGLRTKLSNKLQSINQATSVAQVRAVSWGPAISVSKTSK